MQTYAFLAPEQKIFRDHTVGIQVDAYAFGVLAYFLLMRTFPDGYFPLPNDARPDLQLNWNRLIMGCLQPSPAKRPSSLPAALESVRAREVPAAPVYEPPAAAPPPPEPSFARYEKNTRNTYRAANGAPLLTGGILRLLSQKMRPRR